MAKKQVGLVLFWIGAVWAILWGILGSIGVSSAFRTSTMAELDQTMWAFMGFWHLLWGLSTPVAAVVAGVGILLYAGAGVPTALKYGSGFWWQGSWLWPSPSSGTSRPSSESADP